MLAITQRLFRELSQAFETACGWGLLAAGLYVVMFIDVTGNGSLCSSLRGLNEHVMAPVESANALRAIKVPARPRSEQSYDDRMFIVADEPAQEAMSTASIPAPDASYAGPLSGFADAPGDPDVGKNWKRGIQGRLRNFTVYGQGDQTSSALARVSALSEPPVAVRLPVATPGSAAAVGVTAAARPGVGARLIEGYVARSGAVRNIR